LTRAEPEPADAGRPLAVPAFASPAAEPVRGPPVRAPPAAALAAPDPEAPGDPGRGDPGRGDPGRGELCAVRTEPTGPAVVAPAAPIGSQFLNMKNCWPSVHRLVVTQ